MLQRAMAAFRGTLGGRRALLSPSPAMQDMWRLSWRRTMANSSKLARGGQARLTWTRQPTAAQRTRGPSRVPSRSAAAPWRPHRQTARRSFHSTGPRRSGGKAEVEPPEETLSLTQRMKKLSREYGWATLGVYMGLTVLDFPFCFLLVRLVGTDKIAEAEHWVVSKVSRFVPERVKDMWHEWRASGRSADDDLGEAAVTVVEGQDKAGWGVQEAQERNRTEASLATQLALAYAIHKSFIFVRVPLTAAITPRVVKILRGWGWQIGKRRSKR